MLKLLPKSDTIGKPSDTLPGIGSIPEPGKGRAAIAKQ